MSGWKLQFRDIRRLIAVFMSMHDGSNATMHEHIERLREALAKPTPKPDGERPMFSNPPSPLVELEDPLRKFADDVRARVVADYGQQYADDLWDRLRK